MSIQWIDRQGPALACPVCGDTGAKPAVLDVDSPFDRTTPLTLLRCTGCGTRFFEKQDVPAYEETSHGAAGSVKFYVEQGAGIDVMLRPLFMVDHTRVGRYFEVGCGFGFSLDFARRTLGWTAQAMDPSVTAQAGRAQLDLPVEHAYLTETSEIANAPFDLMMCSEVIEHVPRPDHFISVIRRVLADDGTLLLTTPDGDSVRPDVPMGTLLPLLSPGYHLILFTRESLADFLRRQGFAHVDVTVDGPTLIAAASNRPVTLDTAATVDRGLYRRYLTERIPTVQADTPLATGLRYRLFKEQVNAGSYAEAVRTFDDLAATIKRQFGLDVTRPARLELPAADSFDAVSRACPFNLCSILYFRGIIALNHDDDPASANAFFRASERAGRVLRGALQAIGADDGETADLMMHARLHGIATLAHLNPGAAVAELQAMEDTGRLPPLLDMTPAALARTRRDVFARLVNTGANDPASDLRDRVAADVDALAGVEKASLAFALGIHALNVLGDMPAAAESFGTARSAAEGTGSAGADLYWQATYHQALALSRAGETEAARPLAEAVKAAPAGAQPPEALRRAAAELLKS